MFAPVTHILPLTTVRRERKLPIDGRVVARQGQTVSASDVIAETRLAREHILLDVARSLGVSIAAADKLIKCQEGEKLAAGTVVAESNGLIRQTVKTPRDGRVVAAGGGQVLLEANEVNIELKAGLPGTVVDVIPNRGVAIQASGALIQGAWGNGRMETGVLTSLLEKPDDIFVASRLEMGMRGAIILAGHCRDADAIKIAIETQVRGLILSSINPALLPIAAQARFPIIVTDGFGPIPMNSAAFKLLSTSLKRDTTILAESYDRYTGARPEIFMPVSISQTPVEPKEMETFAVGQQVLLTRAPHAGQLATISGLHPELALLPSGVRARAAEVRLASGDQMLVPLVNLEVVG